jgi:hypothetical protein
MQKARLIIQNDLMSRHIFKAGFANLANHEKQKNGWQKNGGESAAIFIFLPAIFLLARS